MSLILRLVFLVAFTLPLAACETQTTVTELPDGEVITVTENGKIYARIINWGANKNGLIVDGGIEGCRVDLSEHVKPTDPVYIKFKPSGKGGCTVDIGNKVVQDD